MSNTLIIKNKLQSFNKTIAVPGDKSLSIRWILFASLASGISSASNLLISEDVLASIEAVKKLGIKVIFKNDKCLIYGKGINGYNYKKNITINARNSGTLARLLPGLLVNSPFKIKIIGDKSLSRRDFKRIAEPLREFGAILNLNNNYRLPLSIIGSKNLRPIKYYENKGSAQCKSSVILAALRTFGKTKIKAKKSRNHTELLCKYLKLPIKVISKKKNDFIEIGSVKKINPFNYKLPCDMSSSAFFIVLTSLTKNSNLVIKNVNINPSRIGIVTILRKMGVKIFFKNKKIYKGEDIADVQVISPKKLKCINCSPELNSAAIDEFLLIFLVAAKANGVSSFKKISELNQKESPRLKWGRNILYKMGIKTVMTNDSIKIYGNPNLNINKKIIIKKYLKDHRVFMSSVIAALSFGGKWKIYDKNSINTSFPSFLKIIKKLKN